MPQTRLHKFYLPIKRLIPSWLHNIFRFIGTSILGPIYYFGYKTGFFLSTFKRAALDKNGQPIPWYTYPANDVLRQRDFGNKTVLEFGGGMSTLWWASRANSVVTLEGEKEWFEKLAADIPSNVTLELVSVADTESNIRDIRKFLENLGRKYYDVICIDGMFRAEIVDVAMEYRGSDGLIICDNSEGYGFKEALENSGLLRVDFFGQTPAVAIPHATSIYFENASNFFSAKHPIPVIALEE